MSGNAEREFLRHTLATLAYRSRKVLTGAPPEFSSFRPCDSHQATQGCRSAGEILAHLSDLMDWGTSMAAGAQAWRESEPRAWDADVARFFEALARFDAQLAAAGPLGSRAEGLFQGPVADALTHIGQIAIMRRLAGAPVRGENYFKAQITAGRVGQDQAAPVREF